MKENNAFSGKVEPSKTRSFQPGGSDGSDGRSQTSRSDGHGRSGRTRQLVGLKNLVCSDTVCLLALLIGITLVFCVLYGKFLFTGAVFAYLDVGSDTINQYIPSFLFDADHIRRGTSFVYELQSGLGEFYGSRLYQYLLPGNLPLLFITESNVAAVLLMTAYLKYLILGVFGFLFFRQLFRSGEIACLLGLCWCFSPYNLMWGQHYQFLTIICAFTIAFYGLQLFLDEDRKRWLLLPCLVVLAFTNYLTLYQFCLLGAVYSFCYLWWKKVPLKTILRKALFCVLVIILAAGIAGEYLLPMVWRILSSTRISSLTKTPEGLIYGPRYLLSFLGRWLGNDLLGWGNGFTGPANYYEIASISGGFLSLLSFCVLVQSPYWKRTLVILLVLAVLLVFPIFSQVLAFRASTQRWTYLIVFVQLLGTGTAIKYLIGIKETAEPDRPTDPAEKGFVSKKALKALVGTDLIYVLAIAVLKIGEGAGGYALQGKILITLLLVLALWNGIICLLIVAARQTGGTTVKAARLALIAMAAAEIVLMNWNGINDRPIVTKEMWENGLFEDGTKELLSWIQTQEQLEQQETENRQGQQEQQEQHRAQNEDTDQAKALYRVNKTYDSVSYNDSLVQGYAGAASYSSTTPQPLVNLYRSLGYYLADTDTNTGANWIRFSGAAPVENTLLGVKYVLADGNASLNEAFYQLVYEDPSSGKRVFRLRYGSGFGVLYTQRFEKAAFEAASEAKKRQMLLEGYYYTDEPADFSADAAEISAETAESAAGTAGSSAGMENSPAGTATTVNIPADESVRQIDLKPYLTDTYSVEIDQGDGQDWLIHTTGGDMQLSFEAPAITEDEYIADVQVSMSVPQATFLQVYVETQEHPFAEGFSKKVQVPSGESVVSVDLSDYVHITAIRIDPTAQSQDLCLHSVQAEVCSSADMAEKLKRLEETGTVSLFQTGNVFEGTVTNAENKAGMVCTSLIYSDDFAVWVDGGAAKTLNVNGGLMGFEVTSGEHAIRIEYQNHVQQTGRMIGLAALLILGAAGFVNMMRKRKKI